MKVNELKKAGLGKPASINTYFSGWIENFGVVPLFLSAAFLFLPIFLSLLALLVFVTRVLETIYQLLTLSIQHKRISYIALKMLIVKGFLVTPAYASADSLTMSIGEIRELRYENLKTFTVGNKEIAGVKYNSTSKSFLFNAKKIGHTEVVLWNQKGEKSSISLFIVDKRGQLIIHQVSELIKSTGINYRITAGQIVIEDEIDTLQKYQLLHKILKARENKIIIKAQLSPALRNAIIFKVYQLFFDEYIDDISCNFEQININCHYYKESSLSQDSFQFLKENYFINFIQLKYALAAKNFRVKFKVIALEKADGSEINFGLEKLQTNMDTLFKEGLVSFIKDNEIFFNEHELRASTLAEPEIVIKANEPSQIQVGSEIPYQQSSQMGTDTQWKFAGLKMKVKISNQGKKLYLDYNNEFTAPSEQTVSGSKGKSKLRFVLGMPIKLFEIGLKTNLQKDSSLPILGEIPWLGSLFKQSNQMHNFKRIIAYVTVEQHQ